MSPLFRTIVFSSACGVLPLLGQTNSSPATLPVVHTWGELFNTAPISVPSDKILRAGAKDAARDRVQVWVGIDRGYSTAHSGAVLYCLARGVNFTHDARPSFGPFWFRVDPQSGWPIVMPSGTGNNVSVAFSASDYLLFTQMLPLDRPGRDFVGIYPWVGIDPNKPRPSAAIALAVGGEPALPWSPWEISPLERWTGGGGPEPLDSAFVTEIVRNPDAVVAIPQAPPVSVYHVLPALNAPLPQLVSDRPDPGVKLALEDNRLIVDLPQRIVTFFPDGYFLTRWWLNNRPVRLGPRHMPTQATVETISGEARYVKKIRFALDFQPSRLGAHQGDRLGVQLLFCPYGWVGCTDQPLNSPFAQSSPPDNPGTVKSFAQPSNRIDFIYSGDPKNFVQK